MNRQLQMTIYLNEADRLGDFPLHEELLRRLFHGHAPGATVFRGWMGFGRHAFVHRQGLFGVSDDHPVAIVVIGEPEQIRTLLARVREIAPDTLVTLHEVEVYAPQARG